VSDEHVSVRPWLYTVARNLVCDHHRARAVRPDERTDIELSDVPDRNDFVAHLTNVDQVARAMARLSPEHRDVLVEIYYRDQTLADAARQLRVPIGTVKSRLHYAQQAMRFALSNPGSPDAAVTRRTIAMLPAVA
jgi:RNA polymerase sigma-70 factor (ECF subfamily)